MRTYSGLQSSSGIAGCMAMVRCFELDKTGTLPLTRNVKRNVAKCPSLIS